MAYLDDPTVNSVNIFESSNIHIHDKLETIQLDNQEFVFAPWHEDHSIIAEYLQTVSEKQDKIFLGHLALEGSRVFGGSDTSGSICAKSGIKINDLKDFKRAFLGHFHLHSTSAEDKILYVGSPIQSDFGESGNLDKGFVLYDADKDIWELQRQPFANKYLSIDEDEMENWINNPDSIPNLDGMKIRIQNVLKGQFSDQAKITKYSKFLKKRGKIPIYFYSFIFFLKRIRHDPRTLSSNELQI